MTFWIGVDLDGTLARNDWVPRGEEIGEPIKPMVERIHRWIEMKYTVKIFTARASVPEHIPAVKQWLKKHNLPDLDITNQKDYNMVQLWDDRAIQVEPNTGQPIDPRVL